MKCSENIVCFTDASYLDGVAGVACVFKKLDNSIDKLELSRVAAADILFAELKAILKGARSLFDRKFEVNNVQMYTDNKIAVDFINRKTKCPKEYLDIVKEIQCYGFPVEWIPRKENKQADALAMYAVRRGSGFCM